MTEDLICIGEEQVIIDYQLFFYERISFGVESRRYDPSAGFSGTAYGRNKGSLTYQVVEIPQLRRYHSVGSHQHCGGTGYWITNHTGEIEGSAVQYTNWQNREAWGFPSSIYPYAVGVFGGIPQEIVDAWLANGTGWKSFSGYPPVTYIGQCPENPPYSSTAALSVSLLGTFQEYVSYWDLLIYEDGNIIFSRSDPEREQPYGFDEYADYLIGSGENRWGSPEEINPDTGRSNLTITSFPSRVESRSFTYTKRNRSNGIRLVDYANGAGADFRVEERTTTTNSYAGGAIIYRNGIAGIDGYWTSCDLECPPDTCAVDCDTHICCYDSNGIAVFSFEK